MTPHKILLFCILLVNLPTQTHDFYYVQAMVNQITIDNFQETWDRSLQKSLRDLYHGPLHKQRILQILNEKANEFKKLPRIDYEEFAFIYGGFIGASHCANVLISHIENKLIAFPPFDMCDQDSLIPGAVLSSYRMRKDVINYGTRLLSIPLWFYGLRYIHQYNHKIKNAVLQIRVFQDTLD